MIIVSDGKKNVTVGRYMNWERAEDVFDDILNNVFPEPIILTNNDIDENCIDRIMPNVHMVPCSSESVSIQTIDGTYYMPKE